MSRALTLPHRDSMENPPSSSTFTPAAASHVALSILFACANVRAPSPRSCRRISFNISGTYLGTSTNAFRTSKAALTLLRHFVVANAVNCRVAFIASSPSRALNPNPRWSITIVEQSLNEHFIAVADDARDSRRETSRADDDGSADTVASSRTMTTRTRSSGAVPAPASVANDVSTSYVSRARRTSISMRVRGARRCVSQSFEYSTNFSTSRRPRDS